MLNPITIKIAGRKIMLAHRYTDDHGSCIWGGCSELGGHSCELKLSQDENGQCEATVHLDAVAETGEVLRFISSVSATMDSPQEAVDDAVGFLPVAGVVLTGGAK